MNQTAKKIDTLIDPVCGMAVSTRRIRNRLATFANKRYLLIVIIKSAGENTIN